MKKGLTGYTYKKGEEKNKQIHIRVTEGDKELIEQYAFFSNKSVSEFVLDCVFNTINNTNKKQK